MPVPLPDLRLPGRGPAWKWWVCGLLLLATMINYMDRLTLNLLADPIMRDLHFGALHYARIESGFALAFALGAVVFGFVVDRWNVCWVYPLAVLGWSLAGLGSGFATGFLSLWACRFLLGLAESANWPCALCTTQRILPPGERALGNSLLQSGAAVGAILIPLVLLALFDQARPETWRTPFLVVGAAGTLWVFLWWASVRPADLAPVPLASGEHHPEHPPPLPLNLLVRRLGALVLLVITINMTWHFLRAWLPLFLRDQHGYNQQTISLFSSGYYICTDAGALSAGFLTLRLHRRGLSVHNSRRLVFLGCALLAALALAAPFVSGPLVLPLLFVVGFGALGVFPNYYSFSQDLTIRHQGKLTGILGCCCWLAMAGWQELIGRVVQETGSYTPCFLIAGLAPLTGFLGLVLLWGRPQPAVVVSADLLQGQKDRLLDQHLLSTTGPAEQQVQRG